MHVKQPKGTIRSRGKFVWGMAVWLCLALAGGVWAAETAKPAEPAATPTPATEVNGTVVVINGEPLAANDFQKELEKQYGRQVLYNMVLEKLLDQAMQKQHLEITPADTQQVLQRYRRQFPSDQEFQLWQMQMQMQNPEMFARQLRLEAMVWKLTTKDVVVTEQEINDYFNAHKEEMATPAEVKASHILVKTEDEAKKLIEELAKGADFAELAKKNSTDPGTKDEGGDLGFFKKEEMVPEFSEAAFGLKVGEYTQTPVKTQFGYHIIKVTDRKEAQPAKLEEHKEEIKQILMEEKAKPFMQLVNELFQNAKFEVKWPKYQGFFDSLKAQAAAPTAPAETIAPVSGEGGAAKEEKPAS